MDNTVLIRKYEEKDLEFIQKIAASTVFFGDSVSNLFDDEQFFFDSFFNYYTEYEKESLFIAEVNSNIAGYLSGCLDTVSAKRIITKKIYPEVLKKLLLFKYKIKSKTLKFLRNHVLSSIFDKHFKINYKEYPSHLHINLDKNFRGFGAGRKLLERYLNYLKEKNSKGVFLETTDLNEAACILYEKVGFKILFKTKTLLWKSFIKGDVHSIIYGLRFK